MPPPNWDWRNGFTNYPLPQGNPQLREAIAAYHSRLSGMPISAAEVLVKAGGTGAISAAMLTLLNPGDEVLIMDPCYSLYADVARVVGATVVHVPLTARFRVDLDGVRRALSGRTRMLVLNCPSNPTGQLLQPAELDGLAAIAVERDLAVRPGTEFGRCGEQHLRLSFSPAPEIIGTGVQILRSALEELAVEG